MKLYTEEQIKDAINVARFYQEQIMPNDIIIKKLTPIELPSNEEIKCKDLGSGMHEFYKGGFIEGAQWMKQQILNQNK